MSRTDFTQRWEAALTERGREQARQYERATTLLDNRVTQLISLGEHTEDNYIAESPWRGTGSETVWYVVVDGKRSARAWWTRDEALLAFVSRRHNDGDDTPAVYAARVLQIPVHNDDA